MRAFLALPALLLLAACATPATTTLLPGEPGMPLGALAVQDPKSEADLGVLNVANTQTRLGGKFAATPVPPGRYDSLTAAMPPPASHFMLYFEEGGTKLTAESESVLKAIFAEIAKRAGAEVQITGHTDTVGQQGDNDTLSLKRAQEIREALIAQGLSPTISRAVGRGERELLVPTPDNTAEPRNRRVEITVR